MAFLSGILVKLGILHDHDEAVTDLGDGTDRASKNRCCGMDCCDENGIIRWRDQQAPHAKYVEYVKGGAKVLATEAAYEADKAAGFA